MTKEPKKTVRRNSEDGKFVSKEYADKHPKTTETERVRLKPPPPPPPPKKPPPSPKKKK